MSKLKTEQLKSRKVVKYINVMSPEMTKEKELALKMKYFKEMQKAKERISREKAR